MSEEYEQHLAYIHAKQAIPANLLNELLREISSAQVLSIQRIIAGEVNEVYDVSFADGLNVIVRISRDAEKDFEQEHWAIRACALRGVPVPDVLGIWHRSTQRQPLHICMQRKIDGVLLSNVNVPRSALHRLVVQAGELLSRIHTIPTNGFGYIDGTGAGEFVTPEGEINAFVELEAEFHSLAQRLDLRERDMSLALRLIVADERMVPSHTACLTHNDFCAKHLLVANNAIAGIIDFGEVAGSEPLSDVVRWDYYDGERFPLKWLQEGYTNKEVFAGTFTQRLHIKRLAFSLWVMRWYDRHGYAAGVADARAKFLRDLEQV